MHSAEALSAFDLALEIAAQGIPCFPCSHDKRPAIGRHEPHGNGFYSATVDASTLHEMFDRDNAELVGIPTGPASGLIVLDVDYHHGGGVWEAAHRAELDAAHTRQHSTQHGGRHYVFLNAPGVRNSQAVIAPGIDIRGEGGYAVWPPSPGYTVVDDAPPAPCPTWLLKLILERPVRAERPTYKPNGRAVTSRRIEGFVDWLRNRVGAAAEGAKHVVLRDTALLLGGIIDQTTIGEAEAVDLLISALPSTVRDWEGARQTARWAIEQGRQRPFELPDRPEYEPRRARANGHDPGPEPRDNAPPAGDDTDDTGDTPRPGRILTGAAFIARHVPPVWLIDGIVQRSRLYSCTSLTGHGKTAVWLYNACMIHAGRMVGQLNTFQGNVLFLAGENPADLEARMIGMARTYNIPHERLPYVLPGNFQMSEEEAEALQHEIEALGVPFALIVGDTASSFFPGDDDNSNVQSGRYARTLRTFTHRCVGDPAVVALCHPVKNASRWNLLPRGGGAFLNEMDGNLANWSESLGEITEMHWQAKIRGPDFSPLGYKLRIVETGLRDENDRPEITVIAAPMAEEEVVEHAKQTLANEDVVLRALRDHPDHSWAQIARDAGWLDDAGLPMKPRVQRALRALAADKLVQQPRRGGRWELTEKGEKAARG